MKRYQSAKRVSKNVFTRLSLIAALFWMQPVFSTVFVHTTDENNLSGHMTRLTHPSIDGDPEKLIYVTPRFGKYNPYTVGVWYEEETAQWTIYNEDRSMLPAGAQFNIIAIDPQATPAFTHTATEENTQEYYTFIDHPVSDYNSEAVILITPNWSDAYVPGPLGVWFDGERWSIYRQDKEDLSIGTRFNVLVLQPGSNTITGSEPLEISAFTHKANSGNTRGHITALDRNDPDEVIAITHNWYTDGPYNQGVLGVWYDGSHWTILNQGREMIDENAMFNGLAVRLSTDSANQTVVTQENQILTVIHEGDFSARCILSYVKDGQKRKVKTGQLAQGDASWFNIPYNAQEIRLGVESASGGISRKSIEMAFDKAEEGTYTIQGTFNNHWLAKSE